MKPMRVARLAVACLSAMAAIVAAAAAPELVLHEGVRLRATIASGTVGVTAGEGFGRTYEWNGCSLQSSMMARSARWYGALGIYDPAGAGPVGLLLGRLLGCNGISRTVVEEAQLHFTDAGEAERWLARYSKSFDAVWSNDGLVIRWVASPSRQQLGVDVYQLCVAGQRPTQLPGSSDASIQVERVAGSGPVRHDCAQVSKEVQVHTQRLWQAHWKQADAMNSRVQPK